MKRWFLKPVSLLVWLVFSGLAQAQPDCVLQNCCCGAPTNVGIPDGNFEDPQTGVDIVTYFTGETFGGWTVMAGSVDLKGPNYLNWNIGNPNGNSQFLDLNGFNNGTISTTLTGMTAGNLYTIVIWYAKNTGTPSADCHITVAGGAWLDDNWTATNNGADGWLEICFSFLAEGPSAELQFEGSSSVPVAGMLLDDMTMWGCPNDTEAPIVATPPATPLFLQCSDPVPPPPVLSVTDNCSTNIVSDFMETTIPKACFYALQRTWTFTDDCGNETTVEQFIDIDDTQAPVVSTPPADITVECNSAYLDAFNNWLANNGGGQATDNCSQSVNWQPSYSLPPNGTCGETAVVFSITDDCGNSVLALATFTVADANPPVLLTPVQDLSVPCNADPSAALNSWLANHGGAVAQDACGVTWTNDYSGGPPPQFVAVIFEATDDCGNSLTTFGAFSVENTPDSTLLSSITCDSSSAGVFTQNLTNQFGCDSVVVTTISYSAADSILLAATTCDAAMAGVFVQNLTNQLGCDSVVVTTVALLPSDTVEVFGTSCDPTQTGVFTANFTNQNGCDSVVVTTITYSAVDSTLLANTTCDAAMAGVFVQNLTNQLGCDSLVVTMVALLPSDTVEVFGTSCDPTQVGVFTANLTNQNGCDSLIVTTVTYSAADTTLLAITTCDAAMAGVFVQNLTNQNGCDSLVLTTVTFLASDTVEVFGTSCNPTQIGVFTANLTNQNGCDSLVVTTINYSAADTTLLAATTCDAAMAGTFTQNLVNQNGCDSLVFTTISLVQSDTTALLLTSCNPSDLGVFETVFTNQNGCDSLVITTVVFSQADTTLVAQGSCDPDNVGVFEQVFTNQFGCDSLVVTIISLLPSNQIFFNSTTCDPTAAGIFIQNLTNQFGCDSVVTVTVTLLPNDTTLQSFTTCDPTAAGVFVQNLTNQFGCDSTVVMSISLLPSDEVFFNSTTCDAASAGIFVQNLTNQFGCDSTVTETVTLLPSDTTLLNSTTCDPTAAGIFVQNFTNQTGCDSMVILEVVLAPPPVFSVIVSDFNGYGVSCADESDGSISVATSGMGPFSFLWSNGSNSSTVESLPAGSYTVTVTNTNGCSASGTATITAPTLLETTFAVNDLNCFGQSEGAILVETSGGVLPYEYSLGSGSFQPDSTFTGLGAGAYEVTALDANGCSVAEIIWINMPFQVNVDLGEDLNIGWSENTTITAVVNLPFDSLASVIWSPLDTAGCVGCLSQPIAPIVTTTYSVSIIANNGCEDDDEITVFVDLKRQVYVPNVFSPNGDGLNDLFTIYAKPNTVKKVRSFQVFSRWGESVFEYYNFQPNDPAIGWDGTYRDDLMDVAVFGWFAEVEFLDGSVEVLKGDVMLMR